MRACIHFVNASVRIVKKRYVNLICLEPKRELVSSIILSSDFVL